MPFLPQRRWTRRLLIVALIGSALLSALSVWSLYARWSFAGRIAAILAASDPAEIADLWPQSIPFEADAAAQLLAVARRIKAFGREQAAFYNTPLGKAYDEAHDRGETATPEQLAAMRTIVEKYADLDAAIAKAAACERYASPLDFSLPHPQFMTAIMNSPIEIRSIQRFLGWQMEMAVADQRPEDAVRRGIEILRLAKLYEAEPGLIGSQIAMAVRGAAARALYDALAAGRLSAAMHTQLDRELARCDDAQLMVRVLKTERAISVSAIQSQLGVAPPIVVNTIGWPIKAMYMKMLDYYDVILPLIRAPWHEIYGQDGSSIFQVPTGFGTIADSLASGIQMTYEMSTKTTAVLRSLRIYNALRQYADEHDREANGLGDLRLPVDAAVDPFSGQPLKLKITPAGWLVYSVGKDGQDDGGDLHSQKDVGLGPAALRD